MLVVASVSGKEPARPPCGDSVVEFEPISPCLDTVLPAPNMNCDELIALGALRPEASAHAGSTVVDDASTVPALAKAAVANSPAKTIWRTIMKPS